MRFRRPDDVDAQRSCPRTLGRACARALLFMLACLLPCLDALVVAATLEYQIKAAMIYNFAKFVEWPAESPGQGEGPFVVGVLGRDPFGSALDAALRGKSVFGRKIELRRYRKLADLTPCNLLFVSNSERDRLDDILAAIGAKGVLTIGDMDRFTERGGVIQFVIEHQKIRFVINVERARRSGLRISSKLLRLAAKLDNGAPGGRD